jgi:hypothetical protein
LTDDFSHAINLTVWEICEKAKKTVDKQKEVAYTLANFLGSGYLNRGVELQVYNMAGSKIERG